MATVSTKEIKNRIKSMASTRQITRAMEMVAASKLRRAQAQVLNSRPYFEILYSTIHDIVDSSRDCTSAYLIPRPVKKSLHVVIAGDRGLAGGYNSNILKLCHSEMQGKNAVVLPIGKRCVDYFKGRGLTLLTKSYAEAQAMSAGDCFTVANNLCRLYKQGQFDEIRIGYTNFESVLSQTPTTLRLLPLMQQNGGGEKTPLQDMLYEPDSVAVLETIIPEYLGGVIYGALCESRASEQAARRTAMDSATRNAEDMIASLGLKFNRARQASITQEITEIVAGA